MDTLYTGLFHFGKLMVKVAAGMEKCHQFDMLILIPRKTIGFFKKTAQAAFTGTALGGFFPNKNGYLQCQSSLIFSLNLPK